MGDSSPLRFTYVPQDWITAFYCESARRVDVQELKSDPEKVALPPRVQDRGPRVHAPPFQIQGKHALSAAGKWVIDEQASAKSRNIETGTRPHAALTKKKTRSSIHRPSRTPATILIELHGTAAYPNPKTANFLTGSNER